MNLGFSGGRKAPEERKGQRAVLRIEDRVADTVGESPEVEVRRHGDRGRQVETKDVDRAPGGMSLTPGVVKEEGDRRVRREHDRLTGFGLPAVRDAQKDDWKWFPGALEEQYVRSPLEPEAGIRRVFPPLASTKSTRTTYAGAQGA